MENMDIKKANKIIVPVLLLVFIFLAYSSVLQKSPTYDEPIHLAGGYSSIVNNDHRIDPTNGILPGFWGAFPLLFDNDIKPVNAESKWWGKCDDLKLTEEFLSKNDIDYLFTLSRMMMIFAGVIGGLAVYFSSRKIWGENGGIISLALYVLSPTVLAHTRLITADHFSAIFFFLSAWSFWLLLDFFSVKRFLFVAFSLAGLALSKLSGVLILPVLLVIALVHLLLKNKWGIHCFKYRFVLEKCLQRSLLLFGVFVFLSCFVVSCIWYEYGFRYSMLADENGREVMERVWTFFLNRNYFPNKVIGFCREYKLLPEGYIFGFAAIFKKAFEGSYAFLNGHYSTSGWRSFFPLALGLYVFVAL